KEQAGRWGLERGPDREVQLQPPPGAGGEVVDRSTVREGVQDVVRGPEVQRRGIEFVAHGHLNGTDHGLVTEPDAGPEEELVLIQLARVDREALVGSPDLPPVEEDERVPFVAQAGNGGVDLRARTGPRQA